MTNITRMPWIRKNYTVKKPMIWGEAVRVIQAVVDEKEDEKIKQAWERILQG